jgi:hypothetical protein
MNCRLSFPLISIASVFQTEVKLFQGRLQQKKEDAQFLSASAKAILIKATFLFLAQAGAATRLPPAEAGGN